MRYLFHFFIDDERLFDDDGSVHQDLASARAEAIRAARELMGDRLKGGEALDTDGILATAERFDAGSIFWIVSSHHRSTF